jgi:hypothetical protein
LHWCSLIDENTLSRCPPNWQQLNPLNLNPQGADRLSVKTNPIVVKALALDTKLPNLRIEFAMASIRLGHFSMKSPGQLSAQINSS